MHALGKYSITELHPLPVIFFFLDDMESHSVTHLWIQPAPCVAFQKAALLKIYRP